MITEERVARDTPQHSVPELERRLALAPSPQPRPSAEGPGLLWRLIFVLVGFGLVMLGWTLIMSVFLVFIGLPVFFFGLALMQAQES